MSAPPALKKEKKQMKSVDYDILSIIELVDILSYGLNNYPRIVPMLPKEQIELIQELEKVTTNYKNKINIKQLV